MIGLCSIYKTAIIKCDWIILCLYSLALFWLDSLITRCTASLWLDIHLLPSLAPFWNVHLFPPKRHSLTWLDHYLPLKHHALTWLDHSASLSSHPLMWLDHCVTATLLSLFLIVIGPCPLSSGGLAPSWLNIWACHSASVRPPLAEASCADWSATSCSDSVFNQSLPSAASTPSATASTSH